MWKKRFIWVAYCGDLVFAPLRDFHCSRFPVSFRNHHRKKTARQVEQTLLQAAKQSPDDFGAQQRLGEFYLQQNRLQQGILYLQKAQQLNPQDYNTGYDLSLAYLNSGDIANASTQLHTMIAQRENRRAR